MAKYEVAGFEPGSNGNNPVLQPANSKLGAAHVRELMWKTGKYEHVCVRQYYNRDGRMMYRVLHRMTRTTVKAEK